MKGKSKNSIKKFNMSSEVTLLTNQTSGFRDAVLL